MKSEVIKNLSTLVVAVVLVIINYYILMKYSDSLVLTSIVLVSAGIYQLSDIPVGKKLTAFVFIVPGVSIVIKEFLLGVL